MTTPGERIRAVMPPQLDDVLRRYVNDRTTALLGESAEAWRGAALALSGLADVWSMLGADADDHARFLVAVAYSTHVIDHPATRAALGIDTQNGDTTP